MMKILLVEDEPPILWDIKYQIERCLENCEICQTAYNGKEAIEYLENVQEIPDLLITDIQMPAVNGLELIRYVKQKHPSILCVILTGYGEFSYAQEAIRLGVSDYLLKPVEEQALKELLTRLYHEKYIKNVQQDYQGNHLLTSVNPGKEPCFYATALISFGLIPIYDTSPHTFPVYKEKTKRLNQILSSSLSEQDAFWLINGKTEVEKAIIFNLHSKDISTVKRLFLQLYTKFSENVGKLSMAVDLTINGINETHDSLQNLHHLLTEKMILEESQLLFFDKPSTLGHTSMPLWIKEEIQKLAAIFSALQFQPFQAELKHLLFEIKREKLTQNLLFNTIYELLHACTANFFPSGVNTVNCMACTNDALSLSVTYQQLYQNLNSVFHDIFEDFLDQQRNDMRKDQISFLLDSFIKKNYNQPINTQTLAEQFGFTPAYLSKIFREFKNMSPTEYIVMLRIEKAKELLLQTPPILIKDISLAVGYEEPQYFSRVFKKSTGLSPRQFISQNTKK